MIDNFLLITGNDIPFASARISIHQPTLKQIGLISETAFFAGCQLLQFDKNKIVLEEQGKNNINNYSNFEIIMSIMREKNSNIAQSAVGAQFVLALLFPDFKISFTENKIILEKDQEQFQLDDSTLSQFQQIIASIFCLKDNKKQFNPQSEDAKRIIDKINKGKQKLASMKNGQASSSIFARYMSILAVGEKKSLNQLSNYTVFQLFDQFKRFTLKEQYQLFIKQKLAGAKDVKQVEDWMKDLYSSEEKDKI